MQNAESDADRGDYNKSEEGVIPLVIACLSTAKFLEAIEETLYHIPPLNCAAGTADESPALAVPRQRPQRSRGLRQSRQAVARRWSGFPGRLRGRLR